MSSRWQCPGGKMVAGTEYVFWVVFFSTPIHETTSIICFLHDFHDNGSWASQDEVADGPVVQGQDIQPIYRNHKLANLEGRNKELVLCSETVSHKHACQSCLGWHSNSISENKHVGPVLLLLRHGYCPGLPYSTLPPPFLHHMEGKWVNFTLISCSEGIPDPHCNYIKTLFVLA